MTIGGGIRGAMGSMVWNIGGPKPGDKINGIVKYVIIGYKKEEGGSEWGETHQAVGAWQPQVEEEVPGS